MSNAKEKLKSSDDKSSSFKPFCKANVSDRFLYVRDLK
jgi:hypothetical protein